MYIIIAKVYGKDEHRQKESFNDSKIYDFSKGDIIRKIEVYNSDKTGTNDYSIIVIIRNTYSDCTNELDTQLYDGIFESCKIGTIEIISQGEI